MSLSKMSVTNLGARPSDGSSSRISLGVVMSARPMATICCSPPDMVPAFWLAPLAEDRKERVHAVERLAGCAGRRARCRRPSRGSPAPSSAGTRCGPGGRRRARAASTWSGRRPVMSWPSKTTRPLVGRRKPTMVLNAVDLPAPLGPMTLTISPGAHLERDVVQDGHLAVAGRHAFRAEQGARSRQALARCRGRAGTAARRPSGGDARGSRRPRAGRRSSSAGQ